MNVLGPKLPYGVGFSSIVVTKKTNQLLLVGGYNYSRSGWSRSTMKGILELTNFTSWIELALPSELRYAHLSFPVSEAQKKLFCSK